MPSEMAQSPDPGNCHTRVPRQAPLGDGEDEGEIIIIVCVCPSFPLHCRLTLPHPSSLSLSFSSLSLSSPGPLRSTSDHKGVSVVDQNSQARVIGPLFPRRCEKTKETIL